MSNGSGLFSNQKPAKSHLVQGKGGVAGEITDLRRDLGASLAPLAAFTVDEFSAPAVADPNGIKESFASLAATAVEYTGTDLDGVVGTADMDPPRNITVTTGAGGTPGDSPSEAYITGKGIDGVERTETIALSQSAGTDVGAYAFVSVSKVALKGDGAGTGAALEVGFGTLMGLSKKLKSRCSDVPMVMLEIDNDSTVLAADAVTATFALPAVGLPYGTVDPTTPQAGADYAYVYEFDPTA
jgi:hypothetical protein